MWSIPRSHKKMYFAKRTDKKHGLFTKWKIGICNVTKSAVSGFQTVLMGPNNLLRIDQIRLPETICHRRVYVGCTLTFMINWYRYLTRGLCRSSVIKLLSSNMRKSYRYTAFLFSPETSMNRRGYKRFPCFPRVSERYRQQRRKIFEDTACKWFVPTPGKRTFNTRLKTCFYPLLEKSIELGAIWKRISVELCARSISKNSWSSRAEGRLRSSKVILLIVQGACCILYNTYSVASSLSSISFRPLIRF